MEDRKYIFRREDNGELVEVPWSVMIEQVGGYITLEDGVSARRCLHLEKHEAPAREAPVKKADQTIVSDALGFQAEQLGEYETDRREHGFSDVSFTPDPTCPEFYQARFGSWKARDEYMRHRGMHDQSRGSGVTLSQEDLDRATELVGRVGRGQE
jgi:hypothetical protein